MSNASLAAAKAMRSRAKGDRVGEPCPPLTLVYVMLDLQEERGLTRATQEVRLGSVRNGKATLTVLIRHAS